MSIEDELSEHLEARGRRIEADSDSVIRMEEYRQTSRPWIAAASAAALVAVVGLIAVFVTGSGNDDVIADRPVAASDTEQGAAETSAAASDAAEQTAPAVASPSDIGDVERATSSLDGTPLTFANTGATVPMTWIQQTIVRGGVTYAVGASFGGGDAVTTQLWSTTDGISWDLVGTVASGSNLHVSSVAFGDGGFVAVGTEWQEIDDAASQFYGPGAAETVVWTSPDGAEWTEQRLATALEVGPLPITVFPSSIGVVSGGAVIIGMAEANIEALVFENLPEDVLAIVGDSGRYGFGYGGVPFEFTVDGPAGSVLWSGGPEDLGWDAETTAAVEQMMSSAGGTAGAVVWHSSDLETWAEVENPFGDQVHVQQVLSHNDTLFALGGGPGGSTMWTSTDGLAWTSLDVNLDVDQIVAAHGRIVGNTYLGNEAALVEWVDGAWVAVSPVGALPAPEMWHLQWTTVGPAEIAAVANGYVESEMFAGPPLVTVQADNGLTITNDEMEGTWTVSDGDDVLLEVSMWDQSGAENPVADIETNTLSFLEPSTNEVIATVSFDALDIAQEAAYAQLDGPSGERTALLLSPDGATWSLTDLDSALDGAGHVAHLGIFGKRVVVLRQPFDDQPLTDEEAAVYRAPPLEVWVADIPG